MTLHPEIQALLDAMRDLEIFLRKSDEVFWSSKLGQAADAVARSDAYGLQQFLGFFGGMGSLNDFILHDGGKPLNAENHEFQRLRSKAWALASKLERELR